MAIAENTFFLLCFVADMQGFCVEGGLLLFSLLSIICACALPLLSVLLLNFSVDGVKPGNSFFSLCVSHVSCLCSVVLC